MRTFEGSGLERELFSYFRNVEKSSVGSPLGPYAEYGTSTSPSSELRMPEVVHVKDTHLRLVRANNLMPPQWESLEHGLGHLESDGPGRSYRAVRPGAYAVLWAYYGANGDHAAERNPGRIVAVYPFTLADPSVTSRQPGERALDALDRIRKNRGPSHKRIHREAERLLADAQEAFATAARELPRRRRRPAAERHVDAVRGAQR